MTGRGMLMATILAWLALGAQTVSAQTRSGGGGGFTGSFQNQPLGGLSSGSSGGFGNTTGSSSGQFGASNTRTGSLSNPFANRTDPFSTSRERGFNTGRTTTTNYSSLGVPFGAIAGQARLGTGRTPSQQPTGYGNQPRATAGGFTRPQYVSRIAFDYSPIPTAQIENSLQTQFAHSYAGAASLPSAANVKIVVDGDVVTMTGEVRSTVEMRLAEALVRLEPGVRQVRNELQVSVTPKLEPD